jgi:hypothetical protein
MIRDFAYLRGEKWKTSAQTAPPEHNYGEAATYYDDHGESVATQPGIRKSVVVVNKPLPPLPNEALPADGLQHSRRQRAERRGRQRSSQSSSGSSQPKTSRHTKHHGRHWPDQKHINGLRELDPMPDNLKPNRQTTFATALPDSGHDPRRRDDQNKFNDKVFYTARIMSPGDKMDFEHDENMPSIISEHPVSKANRYDKTRMTLFAENHS